MKVLDSDLTGYGKRLRKYLVMHGPGVYEIRGLSRALDIRVEDFRATFIELERLGLYQFYPIGSHSVRVVA